MLNKDDKVDLQNILMETSEVLGIKLDFALTDNSGNLVSELMHNQNPIDKWFARHMAQLHCAKPTSDASYTTFSTNPTKSFEQTAGIVGLVESIYVAGCLCGRLYLSHLRIGECDLKCAYAAAVQSGLRTTEEAFSSWFESNIKEIDLLQTAVLERKLNWVSQIVQEKIRYRGEAKAIEKVAEAVAKINNIELALCKILNSVAEVIPFDYGDIRYLDHKNDTIPILVHKERSGCGCEMEQAQPGWSKNLGPRTLQIGQGLTGYAAEKGYDSLPVDDVNDDEWKDIYRPYCKETKSALIICVKRDSKVLGVILLESKTKAHFSAYHERLLKSIAGSVAAVIVKRVEDERVNEKVAKWHEQCVDLLSMINLPNGIEALLHQFAAGIVKVISGCDICKIILHDFRKDELRVAASSARDDSLCPSPYDRLWFKLRRNSICGDVFEQNHYRFELNIQNLDEFQRKDFVKDLGLNVMLAVPIRGSSTETPLGVICLYARDRDSNLESERQIVETIANAVFQALLKLNASSELQALRETTRICEHGPNHTETLKEIAGIACEMTFANACSIFLIERDVRLEQDVLGLKYTTGIVNVTQRGFYRVKDWTRVRYEVGQGIVGKIVEMRCSLRMRKKGLLHVRNGRLMGEFFEANDANAIYQQTLTTSIAFNGKLLGAIRVAGRKGKLPFTALDEIILEAIAGQLGAALAVVQRLETETRGLIQKITHQVISPVAAIKSSCAFLPDYKNDPERQTELLRRIQSGCRLASNFARNFDSLDPDFSLNKEAFALRSIVDEVVDTLETSAKNRNLVINIEASDAWEALSNVECDNVRLSQALFNLLHNATKYAHKGTPIIISVERFETDYILCVQSEGPHIKRRNAGSTEQVDNWDNRSEEERIYDFKRRSVSAELHPQGTGIGLFVVQQIAKKHNGNSWATSIPLGEGDKRAHNKFYIRLPF